jgi:predicted RecB family endonuclease
LSERSLLSDAVRTLAAARAADLGLELIDLGVKDIILPGDMKTLLNKVIEAQKTAEANVILRREEIAAVRSMSQTAKLLEENPVLMRLKVLESYQGLADKVGTLHVVLGPDGAAKLDLKV